MTYWSRFGALLPEDYWLRYVELQLRLPIWPSVVIIPFWLPDLATKSFVYGAFALLRL